MTDRRKTKSQLLSEIQDLRAILADLQVRQANYIKEITDLKAAAQSLRKSEEKYKELAELLPQIVYEIDNQGGFTFINLVTARRP